MTDWDKDLNALWTELNRDLKEAENQLKTDSTPAVARWYVRSLLSFIEATNTNLRTSLAEALVARYELTGSHLNVHQLYLLMDEAVALVGAGRTRLVPHRLPLASHTAFILRSWADLVGLETDAIFSDAGWESFQAAIGIRNRITHPKHLQDIELSSDDRATILAGVNWYRDVVTALMKKRNEQLDSDAN